MSTLTSIIPAMPYRYKTTSVSFRNIFNGQSFVQDGYTLSFINDVNTVPPHWKECTHAKTVSKGNQVYYGWYECDYPPLWFIPVADVLNAARNYMYLPLDFQENNDFEIIPFLVDLDDTIAMFSLKFLKSISYGGFTWGIRPFMSDVKSLMNTVGDLQDGIIKSVEKYAGKRVHRRIPLEFEMSGIHSRLQCSGYITLTGYPDMNSAVPSNSRDAFLAFLDEIGLHLDLKTVWDVIPMSFALDYLFPVGDILESIHPRGWYCPTISFTGGYSINLNVDVWTTGYWAGYGGKAKLYYRSPESANLTLTTRPPVVPEWKWPGITETFNLWYLFGKNKRK